LARHLGPGAPADITLIDPDLEWTVDKRQSFSRSSNTPFHGWELKAAPSARLSLAKPSGRSTMV
jgi:dihydroorotase-like cyclic amidohydrolase